MTIPAAARAGRPQGQPVLANKARSEPLVRWGWLLAVGLALQGLAALLVVRGVVDLPRAVLVAASYLVLLLGVSVNLKYLGFRLLLIGLVLNAIVIGANGWRMPVDPDALARTGNHQQAALASGTAMNTPKHAVVARDDMVMWPLADVIAIPPVRRVISIGDTFVYAGTIVTVAGVMRRAFRPGTRTEPEETGTQSAG